MDLTKIRDKNLHKTNRALPFDDLDVDEVLSLVPYQVYGTITSDDAQQPDRLDLLIQEWLLEKYRQTQSVKTRDSYRITLNQYRAALLQQGLDLDRVDCLDKLVTTARLFSAFSAQGKDIAIATSNLRLSILSSFYEFAVRNDLVSVNPIDKIKRGKTQRYQGARAIQQEQLQARLRLIDTETLDGKRGALYSTQ
jgi:site-specific recombinase XerD